MDEGVDPTNMCQHLYGAMNVFRELSSRASEELVLAFEDWLDEVAGELARLRREQPGMGPEALARTLGLPGESIRYLMKREERS